MLTSVIIPAHNEEKYIRATLESYARQSNGTFETIVVANGCSPADNTAQIAEDLGAKVIELEEGNVSLARNVGAEIAEGENLIFNDADTVVAPNYVETIATALDHGKCDYGNVKFHPENCHPITLLYCFSASVSGYWKKTTGGNSFVRREAFNEVNGYDINLMSKISSNVNIPVIASGGVGNLDHLVDGIKSGASAVLAASIFHYGTYSVNEAKQYLASKDIPVRI